MLHVGKVNRLKVSRRVEFGLFLDGEERGEVLLPVRYVPKNSSPGDMLEVFIYLDSSDRLIATTEIPKAYVGEFARLKVVGVEEVGAFLDWGLPKDLFLPFREQTFRPQAGEEVIVYVYVDKSGRICASMRLEKYLEKSKIPYDVGEEVELWIAEKTDLGFTAVIDKRHLGLLFANEVFQKLRSGQKIRGFIRNVREDGKIDLTLQRAGREASEEIGAKILGLLKRQKGFLALNDKTPPKTVYNLFGVSKKKFKAALGGLYKKRLITIGADGIRLV